MLDLIQRSSGLLESAPIARLQATVGQALPGFVAAISVGGLTASVTHLLPILFGNGPQGKA